mgnify:CR=1 FL=1|jgi:hypothetical protein
MVYKLDAEYDYDFLLLAISCYEKDYRMCWLINKALGIEMSREEDLEKKQREEESFHSVFSASVDDDTIQFTLIRNRTEHGVLLPELRQVDYLLRIDGSMETASDIAECLRAIPQVVGVYEVDPMELNDKAHLVIE